MADDSSFMNDIAGAIMHLSHALQKHNMLPPGRIVLSSWDDGQMLKMKAGRECFLPIGMDNLTGKAMDQVEICGVIVQWEPMRRAKIGGFDFV